MRTQGPSQQASPITGHGRRARLPPASHSWPRPPSQSCSQTGPPAGWECVGSPGTQTRSREESGKNCRGWGPSARSHGRALKARRSGRAWAGWTSSVRWAGPRVLRGPPSATTQTTQERVGSPLSPLSRQAGPCRVTVCGAHGATELSEE